MSMPVSEAQARSRDKWDAANLSRFSVAIPKSISDELSEICENKGLKRNAVIRTLIEQFIEENK